MILFTLLLSSCQFLNENYEKAKVFIIGSDEIVSADIDVGVNSPSLSDDPVLRSSQDEKFLFLLDGFVASPDLLMKNTVVEFLQRKDLNWKNMPNLEGHLLRFNGLIEGGEVLALELLIEISKFGDEKSKQLTLTTLAQGFDHDPVTLISLLLKNNEHLDCSFVTNLNSRVEQEIKQKALNARKDSLENVMDAFQTSNESLVLANRCLRNLRITL